VADTGIGIKPEDMTKIFQPLFTTKPRGIGLGLTVSRKNVEAVNGRLTVDSRLGKGTTFTVTLPAGEDAIWKRG
jgi:signal transduction histidine kinase